MPGDNSVTYDAGVFGLRHVSHDLFDNFREVAKNFIVRVIGIRLHELL